jgi:hypothetical protein
MNVRNKDFMVLDGLAAKRTAIVSDSFARPANTTQYAQNDLVANHATAGSVVPLEFENAARLPGRGGRIKGAKLSKDATTATAAAFRVHLYSSAPTPANGDNGAFSTSESGYIGSIDIDMSSGAVTFASPTALAEWSAAVDLPFQAVDGETSIFGLIQNTHATGYTPASGEAFTVTLAIEQD